MFANDRGRGGDNFRRFLAENGDELKSLAGGKNAETVSRILGPRRDALKKAVETGDTGALSEALKDVVGTAEGRRLVERLGAILERASDERTGG